MRKDYKLSASARRRRIFDVIHRGAVWTCVSVTAAALVGCGVFFWQFTESKDDILKLRRKQLEDEIAAKQADALKALSDGDPSPSTSAS